ncbi:2-oxo-4-hydroxy-4-carboxy-5-ureidoimidazoline decarboxylase [Streptomyces echinoruber]|uniref:2-oxo-4-hydroxy-4-carboxy-5-ureidoimidazoline decarboxylase n=1 Tax=Streptomyces echinoruber TaxID=68898 RepID=UPI0035715868
MKFAHPSDTSRPFPITCRHTFHHTFHTAPCRHIHGTHPCHRSQRRGPTLPAHRNPHLPGPVALPRQSGRPAPPTPLERFNTAPADEAERTLLACLHSPRWARRVAAHRPYPDLAALLAAADEAAYDLAPADLAEALADEPPPTLPAGAYSAARTALDAAHAAYRHRFGHPFVICLDGVPPAETPDRLLASVRSRLANDPDEERQLTAEELRRLARGRLARMARGCAIRTTGQRSRGARGRADTPHPR